MAASSAARRRRSAPWCRARPNETAQRVEQARDNPGPAAQEAKQGVARLMEQARSSGALERKAEEVKPAATRAAWVSLAALLLSLVTAVFGAMAGRRDRVVAAV